MKKFIYSPFEGSPAGRKNITKRLFSLLILVVLFVPAFVQAQSAGSVIQNSISNTAQHAQLSSGSGVDLSTFIGDVVKNLLGLLGTVFFVLVLYAGFMWMTAGGNEERVSKAKKILSNSVIGLAVVILAYAITEFVLRTFADSGL